MLIYTSSLSLMP